MDPTNCRDTLLIDVASTVSIGVKQVKIIQSLVQLNNTKNSPIFSDTNSTSSPFFKPNKSITHR